MSKLKVTLLTGRTIDQGVSKEYGKLSDEYQKFVAICEIDPKDMEKLKVKNDSNVKISTKYGSVVIVSKESKRGSHQGIAYMPYGLWANIVVDPKTDGTGMPSFKGIEAEIEAAPKMKALTVPELLKETFKQG